MATEGIFSSVNSEKDKHEDRDRQKCQRAGVGEYITCVHIVITVNPERIASVIFNDFINPATLTSLYDNDFSRRRFLFLPPISSSR